MEISEVQETKFDRVQINVEVGDNVVAIKALTFPTICSPIATSVNINANPHSTRIHKDCSSQIILAAAIGE